MEIQNVADVIAMSDRTSSPTPAIVGASVSGLTLFGVPLPDIVPLLTCIYMIVMIGHASWKWYNDWKDRKAEDEKENRS